MRYQKKRTAREDRVEKLMVSRIYKTAPSAASRLYCLNWTELNWTIHAIHTSIAHYTYIYYIMRGGRRCKLWTLNIARHFIYNARIFVELDSARFLSDNDRHVSTASKRKTTECVPIIAHALRHLKYIHHGIEMKNVFFFRISCLLL